MTGPWDLPLRSDEYRLIRDLVRERLGLWFGPDSRGALARRLRERLEVRGLRSFGEYYHVLRYGPHADEEWEVASDLLTTHETYFFREDYQLRSFSQEILPMLASRSRKRVRLWSAGCSTGEEAYTLAMIVLGSGLFDARDGWDVRIHGSDLSKRCIAWARRGVYGASAFRATPDAQRARWFMPHATLGQFEIGESPRAICQFSQMNLLDETRTSLVGACDVIFCKNVLFYFDEQVRRRVIDLFYERLVPGGLLLLGHAESLVNVSTAFELVHLKEDLVYRKPNLEDMR